MTLKDKMLILLKIKQLKHYVQFTNLCNCVLNLKVLARYFDVYNYTSCLDTFNEPEQRFVPL